LLTLFPYWCIVPSLPHSGSNALRLPVDLRLRRILLVDPDNRTRLSVRRMLDRLHLGEVREAVNSAEAYDILQRAEVPVDLLITELDLPVHDGFALIRGIRNSPELPDPHIAIVAMSTQRDGNILSRLQKLDVVSLLVKPVGSRVLFVRIIQALRSVKPRPPDVKTLS
jgi:PleD family two-component response regulator